MIVKRLLFLVLALSLLAPAALASDCLFYFGSEDCAQCDQVNSFLMNLEEQNSLLEVQRYEAYYDYEHAQLLDSYFDHYDVPGEAQGIPAIFLRDSYFVGNTSILTLLEERLEHNDDGSCPALSLGTRIGVVSEHEPKNILSALGFFRITGSALASNVYPGGLFLFALFALGMLHVKRDEILRCGGFFLGASFFVALLYSFHTLGWFGSSLFGFIIRIVFGLCFIVLGIQGMLSFFKHKEAATHKLARFSTPVGMGALGLLGALVALSTQTTTHHILRSLTPTKELLLQVVPLLVYHTLLAHVLIAGVLLYVFFRAESTHEKAQGKENEEELLTHEHDVLSFGVHCLLLVIGLLLLII